MPFTNIFQGVDTIGGLALSSQPQVIPFDYVNIKDNFYRHNVFENPGEVEILQGGLYKVSAMITAQSVSLGGGRYGNPRLHIEIDQGGGFVQQPDNMGGYLLESNNVNIATSITGIGYFQFNAGDKIRLTVLDSADNPPDEETVPYSQRLLIEFVRP